MKKLRAALCLLLLGLLIPALIYARGRLPVDVQPLIEKKYGGWAGTLRLWVYEGWTPGAGSAAGWLNRCAAAFERAHPGVYVQPEYVEAAALRDLGRDGIRPPDMALFPPGALDAAALLPLEVPDAVREPLRYSGCVGEVCYAAPVMLGGYVWAYDPGRLDGIPASWRDAERAPLVSPDAPDRQWSAALLALCSGRHAAASEETPAGEMDLGLRPGEAAPTPAPAADGLPCLLPEGFSFDADAFRHFVNGDGAAMLATQREIARLAALDAQGRGPDWKLAAGAGAFTDQALYIAAVDNGDAERAALCRAFVAHLLGDACQGELRRAGAFAVTDAPSGYAAADPMAALDAALRSDDLAAAPAFDGAWREDAREIVRKFIEDGADPAVQWAALKARLKQISEH